MKSMGLLEYYTTTTAVFKEKDGAVWICPVTPLNKLASLAGHIALMAAVGTVGKLASDLSHR